MALFCSRFKRILEIFLWASLPLWWGYITWTFAWGALKGILLSYVSRMILVVIVVSQGFVVFVERKSCQKSVLSFLSWRFFFCITLALLCIHYGWMVWGVYPFFDSLVYGVFASPYVEEVLTRSLFVRYDFSLKEFFVFNIISSLFFTLMHIGYAENFSSYKEILFERGYFPFSFMMGILVYKTRCIEVSIIMHMLSNFIRYTLPVCVFRSSLPFFSLCWSCIEISCVAFFSFNARKSFDGKEIL